MPDNGPMSTPTRGSSKVSGLQVLVVIVVAGMGIPALFKLKAFDLERDRDELIENAPTTGEGRLRLWFMQVHPRVVEGIRASRFSAAQPWLVSHVVSPATAQDKPEVWGVDLTEIKREWIWLEGLTVHVDLPAPKLLGRMLLVGDNAAGVQIFPSGTVNDGKQLTKRRLEFVLRKLIEALPQDIEGAHYLIKVGASVPTSTGQ